MSRGQAIGPIPRPALVIGWVVVGALAIVLYLVVSGQKTREKEAKLRELREQQALPQQQTVPLSRQPAVPPQQQTKPLGSAALDLPATLGRLRTILSTDSYAWELKLSDSNCDHNQESFYARVQGADTSQSLPAVTAIIYCREGTRPTDSTPVASIEIGALFGGSLRGLHIRIARTDAWNLLSRYQPDVLPLTPGVNSQSALIPKGGPTRYSVSLDLDTTEKVTGVWLKDERFEYLGH
jgi:hypothetical protein